MKHLLVCSLALLLFQSCITDSENEGAKVQYEEIFPIQSIENRWYFSDELGNEFAIRVVDTVIDGGDRYYKILIDEALAKQELQYWILRKSDEFLLGTSLRGSFHALLPKRFKRDGGSFSHAGHDVSYGIHNFYSISNGGMEDVVELNFSNTVFNGFSRIVFANTIGPIRFVDDSGRWPVEYDLDSAYVNGNTVHITK